MADIYVFTDEGVSIENYKSKQDGDEGGGGGGGEGPAIFWSGRGEGNHEEDGEEEEGNPAPFPSEEEEELDNQQQQARRRRKRRLPRRRLPSPGGVEGDLVRQYEVGEEEEEEDDDDDDEQDQDQGQEQEQDEEQERSGGGAPPPDEDEEEDTDETQNPLASLLRLAKSSNFNDGEMVIRSLHETLQYVIDSPKDIKTVLDVMTSLSTHKEPVLRTDLMEQVPQIAFLCQDHPDKLGGLVTGNLVPMVVRFLTDPNDLVRKTSQAALLVLLEQELVSHNDVHDQVCPVILDLTEPDAIDYYKTEAVALMSKMAPLVGREMTERLFTQRFTSLCSDTLFQVRKVCAANFGEFSGVVGTTGTETVLLPHFLNLCQDGVWGVRKACADVFMAVSGACSLETRKKCLSPLFVSLLTDESRWVRLAAFQNLGPFISTFADPSVTGLHYNEDGVLYIGPSPKDQEARTLDADNVLNPEKTWLKGTEDEQSTVPSASAEDKSSEWQIENSEVCLDSSIQIENSSIGTVQGIIPKEENTSSSHVDCAPISESAGVDKKETAASGFLCSSSSYLSSEPSSATEVVVTQSFSCDNDASDDNTQTNATSPPSLVGSFGSLNDNPDYNELNYWRIPLPDLDLDVLCESFQSVVNVHDECAPVSHTPQYSTVQLLDEQEMKLEDVVEVVEEEQQRQQATYPTTHNHTPVSVSSPKDDVQAELEALAASLAESIFCNESSEGKVCERVKLCAPLQEDKLAPELRPTAGIAVSAPSFCLVRDHSQDEDISREEKNPESAVLESTPFGDLEPPCQEESEQQSTVPFVPGDGEVVEEPESSGYEGIDPSMEPSSTQTPFFDSTTVEKEDYSSSPSSAKEDRMYLLNTTTEVSAEYLQSIFNPSEPSCSSGSLLGKYDYSKSFHNLTSFSNLSSLTAGVRTKDRNADSSGKEIYNIWSPEKLRSSYLEPQHTKSSSITMNINQDIVPKTLLEHYISMTDPVRAETVDDEITRHCAYSLPAVALTLGRRYWSLLRKTYETLATDMHWKVRRTLAFSIHELALILGEELAQKDLLPVFEGFIKDLDEVRIGVLKHLAHFLKMLPQPQRELFLPRLNEFLNPDNVNNWRFRLELALQLVPISELFTPKECWLHICPVTFDLMTDKVVEIRRTCFIVMSHLARKLMTETEEFLFLPLSLNLIEQFAHADTWTRRQSYVYVVGQIVRDNSLPLHVVTSLLLPKFLELSYDKVPNIRLVIAKIINSTIMPLDYFQTPENEAVVQVKETLARLQCDPDRDVQYFASHPVHTEVTTEMQEGNFY